MTTQQILSKHLRIRVRNAGVTKVDLTFNAALAENLADLIPEDLEAKLAARHVDVSQIVAKTIAGQFASGELFQMTEGEKQVSIWLE